MDSIILNLQRSMLSVGHKDIVSLALNIYQKNTSVHGIQNVMIGNLENTITKISHVKV